jgi:site-specific recombinase XerD
MNSIIAQDQTLQVVTQGELIQFYRERLRMQGKSANTINTYALRLAKFFDWLGDKAWFEVLPTDAVNYRDHLVESYSVQSVALHMTAARRFYSLMVEGGVLSVNPFAEVAAPKRTNSRSHKRDTFTRDEWRALLATTDGDDPADKRDRAILILAYELALRGVEIVRADLTDLKNNAGLRVLWVQSKGDTEKGDWLVLPEGVESVINDWLAVRGDEPGPLFVSLSHRNYGQRLTTSALRHMWRNRKAKAGIADPGGAKTFHSLRHTAIDSRARYAVKHGKSPFLVQTFARHKSLDTTMGYIHDIGRLDDPPELWGTNHNGSGE